MMLTNGNTTSKNKTFTACFAWKHADFLWLSGQAIVLWYFGGIV